MTASLYDSPTWRALFHDADLAPLFTDTAELRAMLLTMGTLALTQAKAGQVPDVSAQAIQRASMEVQVDPAALSKMTAETGDPVLALVAAFQGEMKAPEHAKWVHFESDTALTAATGLSLRLRQSLKIIATRRGDATPLAHTTWLRAYHHDPVIRAGLATGLGLTDAGDTTPIASIASLADWVATVGAGLTATTAVQHAVQHQLPHLNAALQSAPNDTAPLVQAMTLPQMVLGLGRLLDERPHFA
jgi:3-carboxy-cis,cis-muconate cycloisomerase